MKSDSSYVRLELLIQSINPSSIINYWYMNIQRRILLAREGKSVRSVAFLCHVMIGIIIIYVV